MPKVLTAVVILLTAWPCLAQQGTTGELNGTVRSAGQPLTGVTVNLTCSSLTTTRTTVTGENGGYLFSLLPPGDCVVRFELNGFTTVEKRLAIVAAGSMRADAELVAAALHEEITVKPAMQSGEPSVSTNLDSSLLRELPGSRNIRAATLLSPSVNTLGILNGLVISGGPSWDSLFLIDGVAASAYLTGQPHNVELEDAIQEVVVLSGTISAEYGRFTGGVVSTVTKSGGNEFSGSARDTLTNPAWTAPTPWPGQTHTSGAVNHAFEATLGGFVLKDRLWFFTGLRNARTTQNLFTTFTNIPYSSPSHDQRWEGKLTGQITPRHQLVLSYSDAHLEEKNVLDTRGFGNALDLASLIPDRLQPTQLLSATYNGMVGANATAELEYSEKRYALRGNGGTSRDPIAGTAINVQSFGSMNAPIGCGVCGDDARNSRSLVAKSTLYRNTRWGNHTAVVGGEGFYETRTNTATRTASNFNIVAAQPHRVGQSTIYPYFKPGTTMIDWTEPYTNNQGAHLNTFSGFANDRWQISSRTTLNLGMRYDRNNAHDAAGRLVSNDAGWAPRLSAMFDVRGDGSQELIAGFGRYAAKILEGGGNPQQVGTFNQLGWFYTGEDINGPSVPDSRLLPPQQALAQLFAWFLAQGGTSNLATASFITTPDTTNVFPAPLQSPSVDERTLGYAIRLHRADFRADLIARDWHHFYASKIDSTTPQHMYPSGQKYDVSFVVNDNSETKRQYRALQLQGSWHATHVRAGGGYVLSTLRGNDDEEDGVALMTPRNLPLSLWYPEVLGYPQRRPFGNLLQDQRNRARVWIGYDRSGFSAFVLQRLETGRPYSAFFNVNLSHPDFTHPDYALTQVTQTPYYINGRGSYRTDDVYSTDASLQYQVPLRDVQVFAKLDVMNIFNEAAVVAPNTTVNTGGSFNPFTTRPVEGVNYTFGNQFGKPTGPKSYQTPRTYQVAFGARF